MKLFLCLDCSDVLKMLVNKWRYCECKKSSGRYLEDGDFAEIRGKAIPLGILNSTIVKAICNRNIHNYSEEDLSSLNISAFIFSKEYYKIKKLN
ncbi:MAG TPA: hypothetical protein PLP33_14665 [Leptospiraceae bacterium]|nr:hypothetical protein [Leptospiraceae bacterium]